MVGFINSFLISYAANNIPLLREMFAKSGNKKIEKRFAKYYDAALRKWKGDKELRNLIGLNKFRDLQALEKFIEISSDNDKFILKGLLNLWADELSQDKDCVNFICNYKLDQGLNKIDEANEKLNKIISLLKNQTTDTNSINRGRICHSPVKPYIRRFCSSYTDEASGLNEYLGNKRHTLCEFVAGLTEATSNKFILYSSAQTGKSTELKQLCYELQESDLFLPVFLEVRFNSNLRREMLPSSRVINDKEVVIIIDALDEVNGPTYESLLQEIGGYASDHPDFRIVLSCRSNYQIGNILDSFSPLYLNSLSPSDIKTYIDSILDAGNRLMDDIYNNGLIDFALNPFYLNCLIETYKSGKDVLPSTKNELYRLFVEGSFKVKTHPKNIVDEEESSFEEALVSLERLALVMSLLNRQWLDLKEFRLCMNGDNARMANCLRFDIIQKEDGKYFFKHNAFREWLVANFLYSIGPEKTRLLASYSNNGLIKKEWYNILIIWLSFYGKNHSKEIPTILSWLRNGSLDLVTHIDPQLIDTPTRFSFFKRIVLGYKRLGLRLPFSFDEVRRMMQFGESETAVKFLLLEILSSNPDSIYFSNLLDLCYHLNWERLSRINTALCKVLADSILSQIEAGLNANILPEAPLYFLDNEFFAKHHYDRIKKILVPHDEDYKIVKVMIRLIELAGKADDEIEYILEKESLVHNQQVGNTTHVVSRSVIYTTLATAREEYSIERILAHRFNSTYYEGEYEQNEYLDLMLGVLQKARDFILHGNETLIPLIEDSFLYLTEDHRFSRSIFRKDPQSELVNAFRKCYIGAGLNVRGREHFDSLSHKNRGLMKHGEVEKAFRLVCLWMTPEDIRADFSLLKNDNEEDAIRASWYRTIPLPELHNEVLKLFNRKYPQKDWGKKMIFNKMQDFDEIKEQASFRKEVMNALESIPEGTTRWDYIKDLSHRKDRQNEFVMDFIDLFVNREGFFKYEEIEAEVENIDLYESFFMKVASREIMHGNNDGVLDDISIARAIARAKLNVEQFARHRQGRFFLEDALSLMMKGCFTIDASLLPELLPMGRHEIIKEKDEANFGTRYSLFEYIKEHADTKNLVPHLIRGLKEPNDYSPMKYEYASYLIYHRVKSAYPDILEFGFSKDPYSSNALSLLMENGLMIEEIKATMGSMAPKERHWIFSAFLQHRIDIDWIREEMEKDLDFLEDYYKESALNTLLKIGSLKALNYLVDSPGLLFNGGVSFHYDSPEAIKSLCTILEYVIAKSIDNDPFVLDTLLSSLITIAIQSENTFDTVRTELSSLATKGRKYNFLNRIILNIEDKYSANLSAIPSLASALELIDNL